ncbi:MAG: hypothetical protein ACRDVL_00060 [Acidimicrobiia bacterium]
MLTDQPRILPGIGILAISTALVAMVLLRGEPVWAPDPGPGLPDGETFVFITGIDETGLHLDLAEMLTGREARRAAIEDGIIQPGDNLPNDFYIRNPDASSVGTPVMDGAVYYVLTFDATGQIVETEINHGSLRSIYEDPGGAAVIYGFDPEAFPVTVTIENGAIAGFVQVYLP